MPPEELDGAADFEGFYVAVWPDLAGYATSLVGADASDLTQEALTRVYARYRLLRDPRGYAFRIVTNLARDQWRRQGRQRELWQRKLETATPAPVADADLLDAVRRMRSSHREVLLLHYWGDLSVLEMARALHRPEGTVKRRLHEARRALGAILEENS